MSFVCTKGSHQPFNPRLWLNPLVVWEELGLTMQKLKIFTLYSRAPCRTLIGWGGGSVQRPPPPIISVPVRARGLEMVSTAVMSDVGH